MWKQLQIVVQANWTKNCEIYSSAVLLYGPHLTCITYLNLKPRKLEDSLVVYSLWWAKYMLEGAISCTASKHATSVAWRNAWLRDCWTQKMQPFKIYIHHRTNNVLQVSGSTVSSGLVTGYNKLLTFNQINIRSNCTRLFVYQFYNLFNVSYGTAN